MPVPDFQTLMLPVLKLYADGSERASGDAAQPLSEQFQLTAEELAERLPSGRQTRFRNRVAWALGYLKQAGLLESPQRGRYRITQRGREALASNPQRIDIGFLERYPEFQEFRARTGSTNETVVPGGGAVTLSTSETELTPDEQVRAGAARHRTLLAGLLLERVKQAPPAFFENLVVELLVAMGYGGSHEDAAKVVGRAGDGGIDGIIKEDRLGFDSIYVQAKRWDGPVGRPTVQQFAGALQGQRARKGVVITTSTFTREAVDYAAGLQSTIILMDGAQLAQLMIDYGIGVADVETIRLKRIDEDYFAEDAAS
jgi:restriction system protein